MNAHEHKRVSQHVKVLLNRGKVVDCAVLDVAVCMCMNLIKHNVGFLHTAKQHHYPSIGFLHNYIKKSRVIQPPNISLLKSSQPLAQQAHAAPPRRLTQAGVGKAGRRTWGEPGKVGRRALGAGVGTGGGPGEPSREPGTCSRPRCCVRFASIASCRFVRGLFACARGTHRAAQQHRFQGLVHWR